MMHVLIFDVEHGACALVITPNGRRLLFDCGHNATTGWRPGQALRAAGIASIDALIISNFDEDHVSGLRDLFSHVVVERLVRNPSLTPSVVRWLKRDNGMRPGVATAVAALSTTYNVAAQSVDLGGVNLFFMWRNFPYSTTTNDLSLVAFLSYGDHCFLFPGDLEKTGWEALLEVPLFRQSLLTTNVLVASHHGRFNGYSANTFRWCQPQIVVISDGSREFESQFTADIYGRHSRGVVMNGRTRRVLTTRNDGHILFRIPHAGMGHVSLI